MAQWKGAISAAIHGRMNSGAAVGTSGGTAVVRFTVLRSGQVTGAGLSSSSGISPIDGAALAAVLTVPGAVWTWKAFRRRGTAAGLRGLA